MRLACSKTLKSETTMSTSDPFQFDEGAVAGAKSAIGTALPDVATMTRMANDFFRAPTAPALPGVSAPYTSTIPGTEMRQPQFGVPAPSIPSLPSVDKIPSEADIMRLAGAGLPTTFPAEATSFTGTPSMSPLSATLPPTGP